MKFCTRQSRPGSNNPRRVKLRIDPLEDRLTPSAFGSSDGAYFVEAWNGNYNDVKIQPSDQKIVAVGYMATTNNMMAIARYDSQGNNDTTFGANGVTATILGGNHVLGQGLVLQTDGKAIVSGYWGIPGVAKHFLARFKINGALDSSYGGGGFTAVDFDSTALGGGLLGNTVALQSTGKAVLASYESTSSTVDPAVLARFTTSGSLDAGKNGFGSVVQNKAIGYTFSTFGGDGNFHNDLVVQPDDKIVTVGTSATGGTGGFLVARYTASGALDTSFNGTGFTTLLPPGATVARSYGIARQSDGKIVTVGTCTGADGLWDMLVARFNVDGTLDSGFGAGNGYVLFDVDGLTTQTFERGRDVVIQPDGKIVVAGNVSSVVDGAEGSSSILVARFNSDGSTDGTFGIGGFKTVAPQAGHNYSTARQSLALQSNGNIIVAGSDTEFGTTNSHPMLMRFYGTASPLHAGSKPTTISNQTLTQAQMAPLLTEAIARWNAAGVNTSSLKNINVQITDLPGTMLGQAQGNTITLDSNAAGWGWFVDQSPRNDSEFRIRGNQGEQGHMDLLTVLIHETGHLLGFDHQQSGVMADMLFEGTRITAPTSSGSSNRKSAPNLSDRMSVPCSSILARMLLLPGKAISASAL